MTTESPVPIWQEPVRGGYPDRSLVALSGLEQMRSFSQGLAPPPPLAHLFGTLPTAVAEGTASFALPISPWLVSPTGAVAAGPVAVAADGALGCAVQTTLGPATLYTSSELSLTMLRPARVGSTLTAAGQVIHSGRSVALSEVFVLDEERDQLVAHGTSRCTVFPPLDPAPERPATLSPVEVAAHETPDPYLRPVRGEPVSQESWDRMTGLEVLGAQIAGELPSPPIHHLTGLAPTAADEGRASFRLPCTEWLCSPLRTIQGGVIAMVADAALQSAVQTTVPAGTAFASLDIKINFLRPVEPDGSDLVAHGVVTHSGRTIAIAGAEVLNAEGKRVALATGSSMYLPGRPANLRGEGELG
jgi:uncharacterized protein (TIGR00369 family)